MELMMALLCCDSDEETPAEAATAVVVDANADAWLPAVAVAVMTIILRELGMLMTSAWRPTGDRDCDVFIAGR